MDMIGVICPHCQRTDRQVRAGRSGDSQRYKCGWCGRRYIPTPRARGYGEDLRTEARRLRTEGMAIPDIARRLQVSPRSVANWLHPPTEVRTSVPDAATPPENPPLPDRSGWRRTTIHDVAKQALVSTATVSNYLNQRGRMSEATSKRIQDAIESLNFTPSALTRALRQHHTRILGVFIGGLDILDENVGESVTLHLLAGINRGASAGEHNLLHFTGYEWHAQRTLGQPFLNGHIDGLIWVAPPLQTPALDRLVAAGLPVVALLSRHVREGVGYINADNIGALRDVVVHLAAQGHRRIAYLGPVHDSNHLDRREGYRQGLIAAGIPWLASLEVTLENEGDWTPEGFDRLPGYDRALDDWLSLPSPPTAVLLPDDGMALSLGRRLTRRGIRVPDDIVIAGFNDSPDALHGLGGLTTVRQPLKQMGQRAAERLIALIGGAPVSECRVTFPTEIVLRVSTQKSLP